MTGDTARDIGRHRPEISNDSISQSDSTAFQAIEALDLVMNDRRALQTLFVKVIMIFRKREQEWFDRFLESGSTLEVGVFVKCGISLERWAFIPTLLLHCCKSILHEGLSGS